MLFTNGFVLSCVELDTLVNMLLDASSSGRIEQLATEQLGEHFGIIDTDGGGCEYTRSVVFIYAAALIPPSLTGNLFHFFPAL